MKRFTGYVLALVAVLLLATSALGPPKAVKAQSKGKGGGSSGDSPLIKKVVCQEIVISLGAALPSADAVALCGRLERLVFISSSNHTGGLKTEGAGATGLEGADNICNLRAQEAGLPGTYTAWLSDSSTDAKDRVTQSKVPYVRTDGVLVADDFTDLLDCGNPFCLQASIGRRETGEGIAIAAWTGTNVAGLFDGQSCGDWTDTGADGILGSTTESRIIYCQSRQREDCFQKAVIKRGLRRIRRSALRARSSSSQ